MSNTFSQAGETFSREVSPPWLRAWFMALWSGRWKITEKVSFVTIVLRKYQASQMSSAKEPHLAREPWVPDPCFGWFRRVYSALSIDHVCLYVYTRMSICRLFTGMEAVNKMYRGTSVSVRIRYFFSLSLVSYMFSELNVLTLKVFKVFMTFSE